MASPGETSTPAKPPNSTPFSAPTTPPPAYTADWAASVQAYYSGAAAAPAAFFPPVWGGQHLMSPYATPIAYSPMYAPGAVYAHAPMNPGMGYPNAESGNIKSKGALLFGEGGKAASGSGEEENSQRSSGGSATEGSSDTGNESADPQENSKKRSSGDAFQEGEASHPAIATPRKRAPKLPVSAPGRTALAGPTTNLNIGMDIWNPPHAGAALKVRPNVAISAAAAAGANVLMVDNQWAQDDRELKRERRKQSNRESARRSRLRKQQECDDLAKKVAELNGENSALRMELEQLHKVCRELEAENQHIAEGLSSIRGDSLGNLKHGVVVGDGNDRVPLSSTAASTKMNGKLYHLGGNPDLTSR